jgi:hypothetical protein
MSSNDLLLWLSARGEGSWAQFRAAVEEYHVPDDTEDNDPDVDERPAARADSDLPVYQQARIALERLGHVEFFAEDLDNKWRVVPPAVAVNSGSSSTSSTGVLCGARTPSMLALFEERPDIEIDSVPGMPDRVLISGSDPDQVAAAAHEIGAHIQLAAPTSILALLPAVDDRLAWSYARLPVTPGWRVEHFSSAEMGWRESSVGDAQKSRFGLFRFRQKHQGYYFLCTRGGIYQVNVQVGKYAVMRRRNRRLLSYDAEACIMSFPVIFRPPPLVERALVLCSGLLPPFDRSTGCIEYAAIPADVARLVAQLLRQEVR